MARREKRQHRIRQQSETTRTATVTIKNDGYRCANNAQVGNFDTQSSHSIQSVLHSLQRLGVNDRHPSDNEKNQGRTNNVQTDEYANVMAFQSSMQPLGSDGRHLEDSIIMDESQISYAQSDRRRSDRTGNDSGDEQSVVDIELIECECCKRSFAPKVFDKHFDDKGQPKCARFLDKKRPVFNSAKVSFIVLYSTLLSVKSIFPLFSIIVVSAQIL